MKDIMSKAYYAWKTIHYEVFNCRLDTLRALTILVKAVLHKIANPKLHHCTLDCTSVAYYWD